MTSRRRAPMQRADQVRRVGDERGRARREHGQAPRARAAEEPEQQRLGAIVGGVARGDHACARRRPGAPERLVAGGARAGLEVGAGRDGDRAHREGHAEELGHRAGGVELCRGGGAQAMVDAVRHDHVTEPLTQETEDV